MYEELSIDQALNYTLCLIVESKQAFEKHLVEKGHNYVKKAKQILMPWCTITMF